MAQEAAVSNPITLLTKNLADLECSIALIHKKGEAKLQAKEKELEHVQEMLQEAVRKYRLFEAELRRCNAQLEMHKKAVLVMSQFAYELNKVAPADEAIAIRKRSADQLKEEGLVEIVQAAKRLRFPEA